MKWRHYLVGDRRLRRGFLWLPMTIGEVTRWLETAYWEEELVQYRCPHRFVRWDPIWWA